MLKYKTIGGRKMREEQDDFLDYLLETSKLISDEKQSLLVEGLSAYQNSHQYVNEVEFWKWMHQNYYKKDLFSSPQAIANYISQGSGKANWLKLQLQGKGYEWDWMASEKAKVSNLFSKLLLYAKSTKFNDDIIDTRYKHNKKNYQIYSYNQIYLEQALELCDMIFDNNLDKIYFLRQYLKSFETTLRIDKLIKCKKFTKK